jgi:DNA repair photolyase
VSITSLDNEIKRTFEPRTASPQARLNVIEHLSSSGVPVGVLVAPIIPSLTDHELEHLLEAAKAAGATSAGYVLLRLPLEVKDLFREWLAKHYPGRAAHVMSLINQSRGGKDYQSEFGTRMVGTGVFAQLLSRRFELAKRKFGLEEGEGRHDLRTDLFRPPGKNRAQMTLGF